MYTKCNTSFNIEEHCTFFMRECEFWAELSRHIKKFATQDIPTACVTYNKASNEVTMYWNPDYFSILTKNQINSALKHELLHVIMGHLTSRGHGQGWHWNVAQDLAINSMLAESKNDDTSLRSSWFVPGRAITSETPVTDEQDKKDHEHISNLIKGMPPLKSTEFYYNELMKDQGQNPDIHERLTQSYTTADVHDWSEISDDKRDFIKTKIKSYLEKAQRRADQNGSRGWGDISSQMQSDIRRFVGGIVDWRAVLAQFLGTLHRGDRKTSIRKINKRYPYLYSGPKRGRATKLLIAVDQSGSVDDEQLAMFFSELVNLTKRVTVHILPFDCAAKAEMIYVWKRGSVPAFKRVLAGGTDFNAPTMIVNGDELRGQYDGLLIMTDGEASEPVPSRVKRGWVISKNKKLLFPTNELVISLDAEASTFGEWAA